MTVAQLPIPNFMRPSDKRIAAPGEEILVDNFAGGGGASTGIELALGRSVDIAINHDPEAIEMHRRNHPQTHHLCESVWDVDPVKVCAGRKVGVAWFSPDCKHFSRAKGAKPVSKRIRGLAWIAVRWAKRVKPRVIFLENVREFQEWGPLGADNMPCKKRKGQTFKRYVAQLRNLGYAVEWRVLNAAEYGAPTHRRRLFIIARRDGQPIVWPKPTHGPGLLPYRTAAECIDWTIPCPSIFSRKRPLAEKTMRRIAMGLKKYVLENPKPFIVNVQHGGPEFRGQPTGEPLGTVTQKHGYGVVTPYVAQLAHGEGKEGRWGMGSRPATEPVGTIHSGGKNHALVTPHLVEVANSNWSEGHRPADAPAPTITAHPKGGAWAVAAPVLVGTGGPSFSGKPTSVEAPMGAMVGENHKAVVAAFLNKHYGGVVGHGVEQPIGTVTAVDHHSLTLAHLTKFYGTNVGADVNAPMPTVTATGQHLGEVRAFLIKYFSSGGQGQVCDQPLHTITAQDRFGLVTVDGQEYAIADIGLRMLTPRELLCAQFGPELAADYVLPNTASAAVAKIGNSVAPLVAAAIVGANVPELVAKKKTRRAS